ncbi:TlpA family protein disulfide reductase [Pseudidiomarina donghaiensis]|uniref:TlpA family protein disulfide reductase n=1 Tax=Pseudidiomarina donghaiensis TaxID=519452 RepID=A0A432XCN1_9GAMM|nr:TlpA disulfide reductase family protein [Pseudidiomarina donghaiensis]RUO46514.1 TlpA family protein disulfide reductase [Pseudidiomarina donghaiensis]SFV24648.1 Thiol-disulfide isomerase or thioredoxin [Pseudidiomarina donghaiensis]
MRCRFLPVILALSVGLLSACQPASDFQTDDRGGLAWQQLQGQYVVVNYFAEWCAPCLRELPELNEFHHLYGDKVTLLGVSFDGLNNEELAALKQKYNIEFTLIQNEPAPNLPFAMPNALPATYIVTPEGEVKGPLLGEQTLQSLASATGTDTLE